jgi:putative serine protease PepD
MASPFEQGSSLSDEEQQAATSSDDSQPATPDSDSRPEEAPATEPNGPASTHDSAQHQLEPTEYSTETPPPDLDASATPDMAPPPGSTISIDSATDHRPRWRGPLAVASALAAAALLLTGGMAVGRSTAGADAPPAPAPTVAVPPAAVDLQQTVINVIHVVQPSVVQVTSRGSKGSAIGSGEILRSDGYIVTNNHVVAGFSQFAVTLATGQTIQAQLVGVAPADDLAVLRIQLTHLQPIVIGDSRAVRVGEFAIALGSPLGLQQSATFGIVSAIDRQASEAQSGPLLVGLIQTSAPINPGNSGGALVDLQGRLIGIPTLGAENPENGTAAGGIGFASPSDRMKFIADQLIQYGHVVNSGQGFLGIQAIDVTSQMANAFALPAQTGVLVAGFANDAMGASPAQEAGLRRGDIILALSGQPIANEADLAAGLLMLAPGTLVSITVQRGSTQQTVKVKLGERPAQR